MEDQFTHILELLEQSLQSNSDNTAIWSVIIAILALLVTIVVSYITHKQYISSLDPQLSLTLFESNSTLYLSIENTGQSFAKEIKIDIKKIEKNGERNELMLSDLFAVDFTLYPNEKNQGMVALSGKDMQHTILPIIYMEISYIKGNTNKYERFSRTVTFSNNIEETIDFSKLEDALDSISYSNNRVANYIEGRTLFTFDKLNTFPHNSLYKDMKDAFNNVERVENSVDDSLKKREDIVNQQKTYK